MIKKIDSIVGYVGLYEFLSITISMVFVEGHSSLAVLTPCCFPRLKMHMMMMIKSSSPVHESASYDNAQ